MEFIAEKKPPGGGVKKIIPHPPGTCRAPDNEEDVKSAGTSDVSWERVARCTGSHGAPWHSAALARRGCSVKVGNGMDQ